MDKDNLETIVQAKIEMDSALTTLVNLLFAKQSEELPEPSMFVILFCGVMGQMFGRLTKNLSKEEQEQILKFTLERIQEIYMEKDKTDEQKQESEKKYDLSSLQPIGRA